MTYKLYIGANNTTGEVEISELETALNRYFDGYTVEQAIGYWLGKRENSVAVTLVATPNLLNQVITELKTVLQQDAIAYQRVANLNFA